MLPLTLLTAAQGHPILVELKNGETYNGQLLSCDGFMNIMLKEAICTSKNGDRFWRMNECYVRGSTVKYLRIQDDILDIVQKEQQKKALENAAARGGRGGGAAGGPSHAGGRGGHHTMTGAPTGGKPQYQQQQGGRGGYGGPRGGGGAGGQGGRGGYRGGRGGGRGGRGGHESD